MVTRLVNTVSGSDSKERMVKAKITLEDGSVFEGISFGAETPVNGEVVFSTGMVGYTESLTDPSFRGQVLLLSRVLFELHRDQVISGLIGLLFEKTRASYGLTSKNRTSLWDAVVR